MPEEKKDEVLKVGDVVTLKSNPSIRMTIQAFIGESANCVWIDNNKKHEDNFLIVTLSKYIPKSNTASITRW